MSRRFEEHPYEHQFNLHGTKDSVADPATIGIPSFCGVRLWAVDSPYTKNGKTKVAKKFFNSSVSNLIGHLLRMPSEERWVYEIIRAFKPCRIYFDLENVRVPWEEVVAVLHEFMKTLPEFPEVKLEPCLLDASTATKFSQHIILRIIRASDGKEVMMANSYCVGALIRRCFSRMPADSPFLKAIDPKVYTFDRQFRCSGQAKALDGKRFLRLWDGEKFLDADQSLEQMDKGLIQDNTLTLDTIELCEEDGRAAESKCPTFEEYAFLHLNPDNPKDPELKRKASTDLTSPIQEKRSRYRQPGDGKYYPWESVFGTRPASYDEPEPSDFVPSVVVSFGSGYIEDKLPIAKEHIVTPYHTMAFAREKMPESQKEMLGSIVAKAFAKKGGLSREEVAAVRFITRKCETKLNLGELCVQWVKDVTGDSCAKITKTFDSGFFIECPETKMCQLRGGEHATNTIVFVFDVDKVKVLQTCPGHHSCAFAPKAYFELPLEIRYAFFLAKKWRDLFTSTFCL